MAIMKCRECLGQVSDQAGACPHCGAPVVKQKPPPKKLSKTDKILLVPLTLIFVLGIFAWAKGSQEEDVKKAEIEAQATQASAGLQAQHQPSESPSSFAVSKRAELGGQDAFEQIRTSRLEAYKAAPNEIQASAIFNQANSETSEWIARFGPNVKNWVGVISKLRTSHGGSDVHVEIKTTNGAIYAIDDDAPSGSKIYRDLSSLREGMKVVFSGALIPEGAARQWERSATEKGSLKEPEFRVAFTSIGASVVAADSEEITTSKENFSPTPASQGDVASLQPDALPSKTFVNKAKGVCRVIAGVMSVVPNARDHGRPIATVQAEMETTFVEWGLSPEERKGWHQRVADIYYGQITSKEVWNELLPPCEKMPGEVY